MYWLGRFIFPWNLFSSNTQFHPTVAMGIKYIDKQESGTCHRSHWTLGEKKNKCKLKIVNQNWSWWVIVCFVSVCVRACCTQQHVFGIFVYDDKHNRKSSYFLRVQVFYILMAAKSDNTYTRYRTLQYLLVNFDLKKKHAQTHCDKTVQRKWTCATEAQSHAVQTCHTSLLHSYKCLEMKW